MRAFIDTTMMLTFFAAVVVLIVQFVRKKWKSAGIWTGVAFAAVVVGAIAAPPSADNSTAQTAAASAPMPHRQAPPARLHVAIVPGRLKPRVPIPMRTSRSVAKSDEAQYPLPSKICCGDFNAARIKFGDAAQASVPGLDAIPVFSDVASLDEYYRSADDKQCDEDCVRSTYLELKARGSIKLVDVGTAVTVLGDQQDPEAKDYPVCRVRVGYMIGFVICVALGDYSNHG